MGYGGNSNAYSNNNDFQDNEFVDPEMNDMIEKNRVFSASKGQNSNNINNSRVINATGGNSRIIINKSLLKK